MRIFRLPVVLSFVCHAAALASTVWLGNSGVRGPDPVQQYAIPLILIEQDPSVNPMASVPQLSDPPAAEPPSQPTSEEASRAEPSPDLDPPPAVADPPPAVADHPPLEPTPEPGPQARRPEPSATDTGAHAPEAAAPPAPAAAAEQASKKQPPEKPAPAPSAERTAARPAKPPARPKAAPRREASRTVQPMPQPSQVPAMLGGPAHSPSNPAASQVAAVPAPSPAPAAGSAPVISADYRRALSVWLERNKIYPDGARRRREEGSAVLRFRIGRYGQVLSYHLVRTTGYAELDAGIDQMMRGATLPPFPTSMVQADITVSVSIRFNLSR